MLVIILSLVSTSWAQSFLQSPKLNRSALDLNEWWGPPGMIQDESIRPARIFFDDEMIKDLQYRLRNHITFQPPLEGAGFTYGFNSDALPDWLSYWAEEYPFKQREEFLNQFPQYKTNIQGLDIHFIWVRQPPTHKEVVPLLLLHGWPGSIREFYEMIPMVTADDDSRDFVVELIVPCLPGFGFSDAATRPGLGGGQMAVLFRNLMHRLGYTKYYLQGGDWGAIITGFMAVLFPREVLGYHTNWGVVPSLEALGLTLVGAVFPHLVIPPELASRLYPLTDTLASLIEKTGYFHEHATKPDTVGIAMTDSPAGLLAYILEKFSGAVDAANKVLPDGGLHNTFTREQLVDNLMMYWGTRSFTTAIRIYAETANRKHYAVGLEGASTKVPTWVVQAKTEFTYQPPEILSLKYRNLLNTTVLDFGGHFLALEHPQVLTCSVFEALEAFRRWHRNNVE
ncbi:juvenile hormone epoxide hydrolase-like [Pectinophora gossypiella]|uniref:juvenile hormone epoxide hydrolase-like n=1 Tax=Pectinophora gossypiella TaxID=13191 RepID=UPI00214E1ED4|nr:juvenile hormone epoxide hydrolase-like [Pectinophora gossypiella]